MQAADTFTEKTGEGNKSTHEGFSRQLLPSFLLGSLKMASARLRAAQHLLFPRADHLLGKHHTPLVTEISWSRRDDYTAQPLTLSQTRRTWPLCDLGKVFSCPDSFAGQVLWLLFFPSLEKQLLSSPRKGISRRGENCSAAAMPLCCLKMGFFPQVFVIQNTSSCVWALKPPLDEMKSKGSQEFPWVQQEAWTAFWRAVPMFHPAQNTFGFYGCAPAVHLRNISNFLMQRAGVVEVAAAGDSYQEDGCGKPDNRHLINFSIQFAEPRCTMMDGNKLMISKWNFSFI